MRHVFLLFLSFCNFISFGQLSDADFIQDRYTKSIYDIPMRDGNTLHTIVYSPKDTTQTYPFLMKRTCYGISPYSADKMPSRLGPSPFLMRDLYIFVYQDVRGRYMSEGMFDNMRPHIKGNKPKLKNTAKIDESSDTYDTIDWLLKNIDHHNGRVGQWGISYPGFYTAAALPEAHPALVASSPQAPISDFYFDDFHHNGAFLLSYFMTFPVFGVQKSGKVNRSWYADGWNMINQLGLNRKDHYSFYKELTRNHRIDTLYKDNFFWDQVVNHPDYDSFWQKRNLLPHLRDIDHAVLTVGGLFDAEDLYGPLNIFKTIEKYNPKATNRLVMGPWSHGDWAREKGQQKVNHIYFGDSISTYYQKNIEFPFFTFYLKEKGDMMLAKAHIFDTGSKEWKTFKEWPSGENHTLRFSQNQTLTIDKKVASSSVFTYISDPNNPVPFRSEISPVTFTPRRYMTDDQRHASTRPDVLHFATSAFDNEITLSGSITANLIVTTDAEDMDLVVKIIDQYPSEGQNNTNSPKDVQMDGYQQLIRSEVFRGRYRKGFDKPSPFTPNERTKISIPIQDILHTFKKGHKLVVQIQSSWFPFIDVNPQKYVTNIYKATPYDYKIAKITLHGDSEIIIGP